jgi:MoxR-like ATPase
VNERSPLPSPDAPSASSSDDAQALESLARTRRALGEQIARKVVGQREVIDQLLVCLFAGGHASLVGVPGLAKTLLISSLAEAMDLEFSRIQFTPDLMPSDITGSEVLDGGPNAQRNFRFVGGPIFANLVLADEINRTPPKTQAALLQAMQEKRVSAGGKTYPLPQPFHVFATQNPIEQEGTYPLPEAQLDRFMMEIRVGYPDASEEAQIVALPLQAPAQIQAVLSPAALIAHQDFITRIPVPEAVVEHLVRLLRTTRPEDELCPPELRELTRWGAGPRAGQQLLRAAQSRAALNGRPAVAVADVRELTPAVLRHRLVPSFVALSRGVDTDQLLEMTLDACPIRGE